ncbi:MAG: hypothetical protein IH946_06020 [Bacteroidetes bacterium]|nr:hypothetical protein [Bacteroidota bacterium]
MKYTILILFTAIFYIACNKVDPTVDLDFHYDYYPVDTGHTLIYDVDSIFYDDFFVPVKIDTVTYQIKEVIVSTFMDNENRISYRVETFKRYDDDGEWNIEKVFYKNRTATTAERVEDNLRFIKLIFPPKEGTVWKGNAYIVAKDDLKYLKDWEYEIMSEGDPYPVGTLNFNETVTVEQENELNAIEQHYGLEVYAKNVGLIYKQLINLDRKNNAFGDWESGFILTYTINSYIAP